MSKKMLRKQLGLQVKLLPKISPNYRFKTTWKDNEYIGAELEVEGHNLPSELPSSSVWTALIDDSLRVPPGDGGCAYEYILKKPVSPEFFVTKAFPYLRKKLTTDNASADFSMRCSTHIHVGVHQLYLYQVMVYAGLFNIFEDLFWPLLGEDREGFLFCVGSGVSEALPEILTNVSCTGRIHTLYSCEALKYCSLNLRTLRNLGTLEFRGMEGTLDQDRIAAWVSILTALRDYSMTIKPEDVAGLLNTMSAQGPLSFFRTCMGGADSLGYKTILSLHDHNVNNMEDTIYQGINRTQSLFFEPDWEGIERCDELPEDTSEFTGKKKLRKRKTGIGGYTTAEEVAAWVQQQTQAAPAPSLSTASNLISGGGEPVYYFAMESQPVESSED